MIEEFKRPDSFCPVAWKTLSLADFQVINRLQRGNKLCACRGYCEHPESKVSVHWFNLYGFILRSQDVYLSTGKITRLKYQIDKFKATNHCFPFRLIYDRRNEGIYLQKIPSHTHRILGQLLLGAREAAMTIQSGEPSQEHYDTLLMLEKEGLANNSSGEWYITHRGFFALGACVPSENVISIPD